MFSIRQKIFVLQSLAYYSGCANPQDMKRRFSSRRIEFKYQPLKFGTDRLSRNVGKNLPLYGGNNLKDAGALYSNQTSRGEGLKP